MVKQRYWRFTNRLLKADKFYTKQWVCLLRIASSQLSPDKQWRADSLPSRSSGSLKNLSLPGGDLIQTSRCPRRTSSHFVLKANPRETRDGILIGTALDQSFSVVGNGWRQFLPEKETFCANGCIRADLGSGLWTLCIRVYYSLNMTPSRSNHLAQNSRKTSAMKKLDPKMAMSME